MRVYRTVTGRKGSTRFKAVEGCAELQLVAGGKLAYIWIAVPERTVFFGGPTALRSLARAILREVPRAGIIRRNRGKR